MKNRLKDIAIVALLAVVIYFIFFRPKKVDKEVVTKTVKELVDVEVKRVNNKIDKEGFNHAVISEVENVVKGRRYLTDSAAKELDRVKDQLQIKDKQLKHWISYVAVLEGRLLKATASDTSFDYEDKWTKIQYVKAKDSITPGHFNFTYNAEINYAEYWKRKNIFSKKEHYIDLWLSDPRATINGVKRLKISPEERKPVFDMHASGYYLDRLMLGADAHIYIGNSSIGGGYYYDFAENMWRPGLSVKWRIFGF